MVGHSCRRILIKSAALPRGKLFGPFFRGLPCPTCLRPFTSICRYGTPHRYILLTTCTSQPLVVAEQMFLYATALALFLSSTAESPFAPTPNSPAMSSIYARWKLRIASKWEASVSAQSSHVTMHTRQATCAPSLHRVYPHHPSCSSVVPRLISRCMARHVSLQAARTTAGYVNTAERI